MTFKRFNLSAALLTATACFGGVAHAADSACKLSISANDQMQYDRKELSVPASCTQVEVTLTHTGKLPATVMGHNWVLVKSSDLAAVANAGMTAGAQNNYIQPGDARVIAATKLIGGGESASVAFPTSKLSKGEAYSYICTFPGHNAVMRGTFKVG